MIDSQHASVRVIRVVRVVSTADCRTELRVILTTSSNRHRLTRRGCLRASKRRPRIETNSERKKKKSSSGVWSKKYAIDMHAVSQTLATSPLNSLSTTLTPIISTCNKKHLNKIVLHFSCLWISFLASLCSVFNHSVLTWDLAFSCI